MRNKLFERAWPLRLVAPLSAQAQLEEHVLFGGRKWGGKLGDGNPLFISIADVRCSSQLEIPVNLMR